MDIRKDPDGTIISKSGFKIPELKLTPSMLLEKSIVLFGPSKSGKTVLTKHILYTLKDSIDQVIVISPTEPSNKSYEGIVPAPLIHYNLDLPSVPQSTKTKGKSPGIDFLEMIWKRQEALTRVYGSAQNPEIIEKLISMLPMSKKIECDRLIDCGRQQKDKAMDRVKKLYMLNDIHKYKEEVSRIHSKCYEYNIHIYKKFIMDNQELLWKMNLTDEERRCLKYLNSNPRLLLIFDDCAAQLKPIAAKKKESILSKLFYQNRHTYITVVICCQSETDLPANLRGNIFISFFTSNNATTAYFNRASNNYPASIKRYVNGIVEDIFGTQTVGCNPTVKSYRKLVYFRHGDEFYHITAPPIPRFIFGSPALWALCESIQSKDMVPDQDNPYFDKL